jgi:TonB family protein
MRTQTLAFSLLILLGGSALAEIAQAQESPPVHGVSFAPPTGRVSRFTGAGPTGPYYPERAYSSRKSGVAVLDCTVAENGVLRSCSVVSETPPRYDFGSAAKVMARERFILAATPFQVGQVVRVAVPFEPGF